MYFMNAYVNVNVHGIRAQHYFAIFIYSSESIRFWNSVMNNMHIMENFVIFFIWNCFSRFSKYFVPTWNIRAFTLRISWNFKCIFSIIIWTLCFEMKKIKIIFQLCPQCLHTNEKSLFPISKWFYHFASLFLSFSRWSDITFSSFTQIDQSHWLKTIYHWTQVTENSYIFHKKKHFQIKKLIDWWTLRIAHWHHVHLTNYLPTLFQLNDDI